MSHPTALVTTCSTSRMTATRTIIRLVDACKAGDVAGARELALELGAASIDGVDPRSGTTPLYAACRAGRGDIVRLLLDVGADVEMLTIDSHTPLQFACQLGHAAATEALIERRASVNRCEPLAPDEVGWPPLVLAAERGHIDAVATLLAHDADVAAAGPAGCSALHHASAGGHSDVVRLLLRGRASAHCTDTHGRTALECAVAQNQLRCAQLLCAHGAERERGGRTINQTMAWCARTRLWSTRLHHVSLLDEAEAIELLRADGTDVHAMQSSALRRSAAGAAGHPPLPTPLLLALDTLQVDPTHAAARVVADAALPWSPRTHHLFNTSARERAVALLLIGSQLTHRPAASTGCESGGGLIGPTLLSAGEAADSAGPQLPSKRSHGQTGAAGAAVAGIHEAAETSESMSAAGLSATGQGSPPSSPPKLPSIAMDIWLGCVMPHAVQRS